jgi:uncharacterized SAM-binding protein YcdF (DUF218 family)
MIVRLFSILLLLYLLGFILFSVTLGSPASTARTDAVVVITGGPGRIEHGVDVLAKGYAGRMLISGTDPSVTKPDLVRRLGKRSKKLVDCCVDLGSESVDTRSNAEEAKRWLDKHRYKSVRLVTSDWHMRRARYEFRRVMRGKYELIPDGVHTEPRFTTLFAEYNKLLLRRIAILFEL